MNASETSKRYRVLLSQEGGVWLIEAEDLQGVRSFGRTVSDAVRNIREAIAAAEDLDTWDDLDLDYSFDDASVSAAVKRFREAARAEEQAAADRNDALTAAIESLRTRGMSYRDIGTVIGLSHQRVAQLDSQARV
jgi:DNA-directed RNA polymerase specialized sigma24 family protein